MRGGRVDAAHRIVSVMQDGCAQPVVDRVDDHEERFPENDASRPRPPGARFKGHDAWKRLLLVSACRGEQMGERMRCSRQVRYAV